MQTNVKLQEPFSYSIWPIIVFLIMTVAFTIYLILEKRKNKVPNIEEIKIIEPKNIASIKNKYLKKLETLNTKLVGGKIKIRDGYQELSTIIRFFIYEVSDIKVQNYTLSEIEELNMPFLTELIQEYYSPEFAKQSIGNIKQSIEKTRKVIERWS